MLLLKKILFFFIFFTSFSLNANQFSSINPSSLNVAKTDEIVNFLNNKVLTSFFIVWKFSNEIFKNNGTFEFEMFSGEYKGFYSGKWKVENNNICFLYEGTSQYDCVNLYYANDTNGNLQVFF